MQQPQARLLPDGQRLHLQHGPIDMIVQSWGGDRQAAYTRATRRFETILQELVDELTLLRTALPGVPPPDRARSSQPCGAVAMAMVQAAQPFAADYITPMAAVAGAVADEVLSHLAADPKITRAYVNNGGDIALHLGPGETLTTALAATAPARITLTHSDPWRGIATSGWQGRSHSLGIADSVTVLAETAARADAAATMIANATDLPGDPRITRQPAIGLSPDSDLCDRPVTTHVAQLDTASRARALQKGLARATDHIARGLIGAAHLTLQGDARSAGPLPLLTHERDPAHA